MTRSGLILTITLITLAVGTTWWRNRIGPDTQASGAPKNQQADFFMEQFRIRQYNEQGLLEYQLEGQKLEHYPNDDSAKITSPYMQLQQTGGTQWLIEADHAFGDSTALEKINLVGNVEIHKPAAGPNTDPIKINTRSLKILPKTNFAETTDTVTITATNSKITAQTLEADFNQGRFTLSDVRGRYEP